MKITKMKGCGVGFTRLRGLRGDAEEGVRGFCRAKSIICDCERGL